jgi:predicted PurR-regulated permease PerM
LGGSTAGSALLVAATSVRGVAYGVIGTAAIQAIAMALGLIVAGIPGAGLLGFLTLIIALSQVGPLLVVIWGGAAWWLFGHGDNGWAIFICVWGLVVSTVDNLIRPWLVSLGAEMPLIVIFLGVLGGVHCVRVSRLVYRPNLAWRVLPIAPSLARSPGIRKVISRRNCWR